MHCVSVDSIKNILSVNIILIFNRFEITLHLKQQQQPPPHQQRNKNNLFCFKAFDTATFKIGSTLKNKTNGQIDLLYNSN